MSTRSNPFEELQRLLDQMGRQFAEFDDARGSQGGSLQAWGQDAAAPMPLDIEDVDDKLVVTAELPGFDRDEIAVSIDDGTLTIEAEHESTAEEREGTFLHRERTQRTLKRSVSLPAAVDAADVAATYRNGVLTVTLQKSGQSEGTEIDIE
ncbi:Hsp20/alpha crystallin family protein [Haloarchaeobius amylolyticus]|uniref:Hsp20/alpha crystallin family protein n=1 Tax=Haloarchaeobius amylolyticus TaxID=1198296 RepID=UPI00226D4176|nr:Hsp20/alpha crystallin family protein [Haloarchaeobius amylolyticus]